MILYPDHIMNLVFFAQVQKEKDFCVVFDKELNYVFVNKAACRVLGKKAEELIGRSIVELYPDIAASQNHLNLQRALEGVRITDPVLEGPDGSSYWTEYRPLIISNMVEGIIVKAKKNHPALN